MAGTLQVFGKAHARLSQFIFPPLRQFQCSLHRLPRPLAVPRLSPFVLTRNFYLKAASLEAAKDNQSKKAQTPRRCYEESPEKYLESEEYIERYGTDPVWAGYRRNHKGGIPPQRPRKTCIRGDKISGNPCPICRDPNVIIDPENVKLLQQFISPHTGMVYDPSKTGVCLKQYKKMNEAINTARDHGLLAFQIPFVEVSGEDYSNSHSAVGSTPPPSWLTSGDPWYNWYDKITPDEKEVAKVKKTYKAFLK